MPNFSKFDGLGRKPRDIQIQALDWINENWSSKVLCLSLPVGCHALGQKILMFDGTTMAVEDILVGDLLMGPDSTPRQVIELHRGRQRMVKVSPNKGEPFIVNEDHILSLEYTARTGRLANTVLNIPTRNYTNLPSSHIGDLKLYRRGVEFTTKVQTIDPYILGLWLADGTSAGPNLTKEPGILIDTWVQWGLEHGYGTRTEQKTNSKAVTVHLSNGKTGKENTIWRMFRDLNLECNKHIPTNYLTGDKHQRQQILAGILDGDGAVSGGGVDFISKYQHLAEQVAYLCRSLGLAAYVSSCIKSIKSIGFTGTYWRVSISGDCTTLPFKRLMPPARKINKDVRRTGFSLTPLEVGDYYGFSVDCDQLYLLGDFTVTHNSGKSALAKTIANASGAHIITPSNVLIDQYIDTYPEDNFLKGKHHYTCSSGISCYDWTNICEQAPCSNCPYTKSRDRAMTESTFFNPMSLFYATADKRWSTPRTIVIDEAHLLISMLQMLSGFTVGYTAHKFPKNCTNELVLIGWLDNEIRKLGIQLSIYRSDRIKVSKLSAELQTMRLARNGVAENPQNYAIWTHKGTLRGRPELFLNVKPLTPPRNLVNSLLASRNLILMSGTLFPTDIKDLLGDVPYKLLDLPSPIPKERRPIVVKPTAYPMNRFTDPKLIAASIESVIAQHPGENVIIHVTYALSEQLRPHFTQKILANDKANKDATLEEFKKSGGIFLAAGCAEGIDLKGDLCRVNIIPKMPYPNLGDPLVAKRKTLEDGELWYAMQVFKTLIQQVGRSTRSEDDYSITYILDPNFRRKFNEYKTKLPISFVESVQLA